MKRATVLVAALAAILPVVAETDVELRDGPKCDKRIRIDLDARKAHVNESRLDGADLAVVEKRAEWLLSLSVIKPAGNPRIRPLMGWSSWNTFGCDISEGVILETARAMATNGLKNAGYTYVNIDDGFFWGHGEDGILRFNSKRFPNGMKPVVDGIHALGLKAGIYSDAGADTCGSIFGGGPDGNDKGGIGGGLYGHDAADCRLHFNELGFDYIKVDYCGGRKLKLVEKTRYTEIANAIRATGRTDVRFNICRWAFPGTWAADIAESWRTTNDIRANWNSVKNIIRENLYLGAYQKPGHYNDMDMLEVGQIKGQVKTCFGKHDSGLTHEEERTHFGMWCFLSSPLQIGCDVRSIPAESMKLVTNPYLLRMNQNDLGAPPSVVWRDGESYIMAKDADRRYGTARYVALYNARDEEYTFTINAATLELGGPVETFDLAECADMGVFEGEVSVRVPAHGAKFYRMDARERLPRSVYEAENAYLSDYQELRNAADDKNGTAHPAEQKNASCGMVVRYLGKRPSNDLVWKDVMIESDGDHTMTFFVFSFGKRAFNVQIDGGETHRFEVEHCMDAAKSVSFDIPLKAGIHTVRIFNAEAWAPDIDRMTVTKKVPEESVKPWRTPAVNMVNRLPARRIIVPCESESKARTIARLELPREASRYIQTLDGQWDFEWTSGRRGDAPRKAKISVPGCWQLQGNFDIPLYTNSLYPFAATPPVAGGECAEHPDWTVNRFPDPIGIYERTFTVPEGWRGRRIIVHFGGVSSAMTLYVNGCEVGYSEDSRLPAEFDITEHLAAIGEKNKIRVKVRKFCDGSYLEDQDFWRLSGIFRSVWLVAENPDGLHNFTVEADAATGRVTVRDDGGSVVHEETMDGYELWSPENPKIYTIAFEKDGDWFAVNVGFRTISIEAGVFKLNGERILFKGVNRHEMSATGGYTMTREEMEQDMRLLKEFGFNAVRTCHYPDDPLWYELCDMNGIMLVSEANVESHGMGIGDSSLSHRVEWRKAHVERAVNMVKTFREHPSVVIWSLGNESGSGENFAYAKRAVKDIDPSRPVQYEGAVHWRASPEMRKTSDIMCPMYHTPEAVETELRKSADKPYILCEYAHAMGNSTGDVAAYWSLTAKYPTFQGGFVWDFADQGLWQTLPDGSRRLAYGGDFGDKPNYGNFCCNGLFDALRRPHPGAYEMKSIFAKFADCRQQSGRLPLKLANPLPVFWRAPTDNDRGWKMQKTCEAWKKATETGVLPEGCEMRLDATGDVIDFSVTVPEGLPPLPRVGVSFTVPASFTNIAWIGRGPYENYPDRKLSTHFGLWKMNVDELNDSGYILPAEVGHRGDTVRLELSNDAGETIVIETDGAPFGFNVWPWTLADLEAATHVEDLPRREFLTVTLDAATMGVGGDDSWSRHAEPHTEFRLGKGSYFLRVNIKNEFKR